ncbi:hypothetical protein BJV78DRAFT_1158401 [Lactifluus subvellereus]|nr:hypothetical protein BJV78DRAFT_1158401 [Lactifluus subvellereus]
MAKNGTYQKALDGALVGDVAASTCQDARYTHTKYPDVLILPPCCGVGMATTRQAGMTSRAAENLARDTWVAGCRGEGSTVGATRRAMARGYTPEVLPDRMHQSQGKTVERLVDLCCTLGCMLPDQINTRTVRREEHVAHLNNVPGGDSSNFDNGANALYSILYRPGNEAKNHDAAPSVFAGDPSQQKVNYQRQSVTLLAQIPQQFAPIAPRVSIPSAPPPPYFNPSSHHHMLCERVLVHEFRIQSFCGAPRDNYPAVDLRSHRLPAVWSYFEECAMETTLV